ncbi:hypothetical protein [Micromonospora aurantiaca (nom. illeg.)]|uniref:hypothetical protein n=1 Tax=Micromonospora aurantiaca (nom. illeg.) TaxID=47850 RepID=UPI003EB8828E
MIRQVRVELRRSNAPVVTVLLLAVGVLGTASMYRFWQGQWLRLGYVHASDVFLLMPLALAGGAVLGRRDRRTRADELMNSTGRPRWQRALPAMTALGVAVAAAHLLVVAASAAVVASGGAYLGVRGFAGPLIDVLVLVGAAWVGVAVGRLWSSPLLPPLLAAAGLVAQEGTAMLGGSDSRLANTSLMISWPPDTPWETLSDRLLLSRLVLGAGLALAGLLLAAGRSWPVRAGAAASLAGGVAGLLLIGVPGPAGIWQLDPEARRYVCADGTPQVCVTAVNAHLLPQITPEARRGLRALAKLPDAPTRVVEVRWTPSAATTASSGTGPSRHPAPCSSSWKSTRTPVWPRTWPSASPSAAAPRGTAAGAAATTSPRRSPRPGCWTPRRYGCGTPGPATGTPTSSRRRSGPGCGSCARCPSRSSCGGSPRCGTRPRGASRT